MHCEAVPGVRRDENSTNSVLNRASEAGKEPGVAFTLTTVLFLKHFLLYEVRGKNTEEY